MTSAQNTLPASNNKHESQAASPAIPEDQLPQWRADIARMRTLQVEHAQHALRMGDTYNELKQRWGVQMPELAKEAGIPYHAARQRAHVAEMVPDGSPLRETGLSYSVLRLLAPLADPMPWAKHALALQSTGQLRVRAFAQILVNAGLRRPRRSRSYSPPCLNCESLIGAPYGGIHIRGEAGAGWLCGPPCAAEYFDERKRSRRTPPTRSLASTQHESQSRPAASVPNPKSELAPTTPESQSPAPDARPQESGWA